MHIFQLTVISLFFFKYLKYFFTAHMLRRFTDFVEVVGALWQLRKNPCY